MIDFVSTRPDTDVETQRAAQLLASIVAHFVRAASETPTPQEKRDQVNIGPPASAIDYLFAPGSKFELHIETLGGSPVAMREALLSKRPLVGPWFTEEQRRIIQVRHVWWLKALHNLKGEASGNEDVHPV